MRWGVMCACDDRRLPRRRPLGRARRDRAAKLGERNRSPQADRELTTMQDRPTPAEVIGAVAAFLKTTVAAQTSGATSFQARVAANALEMMKRELDLAPAEDAAEHERLKALLGTDGALFDLNVELSRRIATGEIEPSSPGPYRASLGHDDGQARRRPADLRILSRGTRQAGAQGGLTWTSTSPKTSPPTSPSSTASSRPRSSRWSVQDDNIRFFDHRREHARTDWDNQRPAAARVGGAAGRGAPPRRRRRPPALRLAGGVGRQGRHQPRHGDHPRAPGGQGPRPAQRSADRALDRRQQPLHHHVQGVRDQRPVRALRRDACRRARSAPASA